MTTVLVCLVLALAIGLWPTRRRSTPRRAPSGVTGWGSGEIRDSARRVVEAGHLSPERHSGAVLRPEVGAALRARWRARRGDGVPPQDVADALVLIGLALKAGLPLAEALCQVQAEASGRVRSDLGSVIAALHWGRPAQEAWEFAGQGWRAAGRAAHMSDRTGAAPAALIEAAAARLREEHERGRERAIARAGVLLVLPLGLGFLPAFACTAVVPVVLNLASGVLGANL